MKLLLTSLAVHQNTLLNKSEARNPKAESSVIIYLQGLVWTLISSRRGQ